MGESDEAMEAMGTFFLLPYNLANKQAHFDTYIKLKPENYSTDTGKLQAQVQCIPSRCKCA